METATQAAIAAESGPELAGALSAATAAHQPVALATVVGTEGSTPVQVGGKLLVRGDGTRQGNAGGGALEERIAADALLALAAGTPRLAHYALTDEGPDAAGTLCGGAVTVFIEPYVAPSVLLVVGGGHIGQPLAALGRVVGYDVRVVDV